MPEALMPQLPRSSTRVRGSSLGLHFGRAWVAEIDLALYQAVYFGFLKDVVQADKIQSVAFNQSHLPPLMDEIRIIFGEVKA